MGHCFIYIIFHKTKKYQPRCRANIDGTAGSCDTTDIGGNSNIGKYLLVKKLYRLKTVCQMIQYYRIKKKSREAYNTPIK